MSTLIHLNITLTFIWILMILMFLALLYSQGADGYTVY